LKYGLFGYVLNLSEGRVFSVAEGNHDAILGFVEELRKGPQGSNVTDVNVSWSEPTGEYSAFTIRR
jgi:acylphosphatase